MSYNHPPYFSHRLMCHLLSIHPHSTRAAVVLVPKGDYPDMSGAIELSLSVMPECTKVSVVWPNGEATNVYVKRPDGWQCVYVGGNE